MTQTARRIRTVAQSADAADRVARGAQVVVGYAAAYIRRHIERVQLT